MRCRYSFFCSTMRAVSELHKLARVLTRRIGKLQSLATRVRYKNALDCNVETSYIVIETLTTWANFCRTYYLSCALLRAWQISGNRVSHNAWPIADERSALVEAIRILKPNVFRRITNSNRIRINPRDEPVWHDKRTLVRISGQMDFSNNNQILSAFSYPTSFMDELPTIRNFFAHRNSDTAKKVESLARQQYGVSRLGHPSEFVNGVLTGRRESLMIEWLIDIRAIGQSLCN